MPWMLPYRSPDTHTHSPDSSTYPFVLRAEGVKIQYSHSQQWALRGISLELRSGESGVLVGPNGAGKSTFLKTAAGLFHPQEGRVTIFDCPAEHCHPHTCYLPQRSEVRWDYPIRVKHMVRTGAYVRCGWLKRPSQSDRERAGKIMHQLRIDNLADRQIHQLSGGQQQRVLLARAILHDARLYLLDEPFNGVDAETLTIICEVLKGLLQEGSTILATTHFLEAIPFEFDHAWTLLEGSIQKSEK